MKKFYILFVLLISTTFISAQENKRPIKHEDIIKWNRITETHVSNNGEFIVFKQEPWKGDPTLKISNSKGKELVSFVGGSDAKITSDSKHLVFIQKPLVDSIRNLKLKKTKKEDLPQNKLVVHNLKSNKSEVFEKVKSSKVPTEWAGWIAWQSEAAKDTTKKEKTKEADEKVFPLFVKNLKNGEVKEFPAVGSYEFALEKEIITFISEGKDSTFDAGVYVYDLLKNTTTNISNRKADYKQLTINKTGEQIAFLSINTEEEEKSYSLYVWQNSGEASEIVNNSNTVLPENWEISKNGRLSFSENGSRLFFITAPKKATKYKKIIE
jgi:hypothetical protein